MQRLLQLCYGSRSIFVSVLLQLCVSCCFRFALAFALTLLELLLQLCLSGCFSSVLDVCQLQLCLSVYFSVTLVVAFTWVWLLCQLGFRCCFSCALALFPRFFSFALAAALMLIQCLLKHCFSFRFDLACVCISDLPFALALRQLRFSLFSVCFKFV